MKTQLTSLAVLTAFFAGTATAEIVTIPNTFAADTPAVAAEVNANFGAVKTAVDGNQTQIDAVKTTADANKTQIDLNTPQIGDNTANILINSDAIDVLTPLVNNAAIAVPGTTAGEMQYWDGTAWVLIDVPSAANATLGFCGGKPSWSCYAVGDTGPAGGIVFYVAPDGVSGLEAAPADLAGEYTWGCNSLITTAGLTGIGDGATNTSTIIAAGCGGNAAIAAAAYSLDGGITTGWFLPSKDELALLYAQRAVVGISALFYWSSSEVSATDAWDLDFTAGVLETGNGKNTTGVFVRPIRAF